MRAPGRSLARGLPAPPPPLLPPAQRSCLRMGPSPGLPSLGAARDSDKNLAAPDWVCQPRAGRGGCFAGMLDPGPLGGRPQPPKPCRRGRGRRAAGGAVVAASVRGGRAGAQQPAWRGAMQGSVRWRAGAGRRPPPLPQAPSCGRRGGPRHRCRAAARRPPQDAALALSTSQHLPNAAPGPLRPTPPSTRAAGLPCRGPPQGGLPYRQDCVPLILSSARRMV
jgi:hypothetical protein